MNKRNMKKAHENYYKLAENNSMYDFYYHEINQIIKLGYDSNIKASLINIALIGLECGFYLGYKRKEYEVKKQANNKSDKNGKNDKQAKKMKGGA